MTITAKIIADSISPENIRLTTLQLRYPKFIHGEFMTHRVFSRNASSSRAIPVERMVKDVMDDPVLPMHWGKNQPGMSAREECNTMVECILHDYKDEYGTKIVENNIREVAWIRARDQAINMALAFHKAGYHKQIVNRILEPFVHINVVVTATDWSNFFALRIHPDAQPEINELATKIKEEMDKSDPWKCPNKSWHLPYMTFEDWADAPGDQDTVTTNMIKCSVARCARVSYLTQEGKKPNIEDDLKLYDRLVGSKPLHASPAEHQATPDRHLFESTRNPIWMMAHEHGNFKGWRQYRKMLPGETQ